MCDSAAALRVTGVLKCAVIGDAMPTVEPEFGVTVTDTATFGVPGGGA
jgi:hypothetical protein